jgi:hypothetical protein
VAITLDIYSHADPGMQRGTAERVAALVLGTTQPIEEEA